MEGGEMLKLRCSQQNYSSSRAKRLCLLYTLRDVDLAGNPKGDIPCLATDSDCNCDTDTDMDTNTDLDWRYGLQSVS